MRFFWNLLPLVVLAFMFAMAITSAYMMGGRYMDYRKEIISRLWEEEDAPEDVTSEQISKRLVELDIDVRRR
jgi:hypothetical protein